MQLEVNLPKIYVWHLAIALLVVLLLNIVFCIACCCSRKRQEPKESEKLQKPE